MGATIHVRGEGGALWEMDLPLSKDHTSKLADGRLVRVNPDGSRYEAPAAPAPDPSADDEDDHEAEDPDVVAATEPAKPVTRVKPKA
jgi:hypothetical protein